MEIQAGTWLKQGEVDFDLNDVPDEYIVKTDPEKGTKVQVSFDFEPGDNLDEAVSLYGEEVVFERWLRQVRRDGGNAIRSALNNNTRPGRVESRMQDWRPDVTQRGGGADQSIEEQFEDLPEDQKEEKLEKLIAIAQQG